MLKDRTRQEEQEAKAVFIIKVASSGTVAVSFRTKLVNAISGWPRD